MALDRLVGGRLPQLALLKLAVGLAMVVIGSRLLIPAVEETALRLHIPDAIIAATLVAFGTSLPELVGVVFLVLLALYLWRSIAWSKDAPAPDAEEAGLRPKHTPALPTRARCWRC